MDCRMRKNWRSMAFLVLWCVAAGAIAKPKVTEEPVLESDKPDAERLRIFLPELQEGPGTGCFIYYDRPKFLMTVNNDGEVMLRLKTTEGEFAVNGEFHLGGRILTSWAKPVGYDEEQRLITRGINRYMIKLTDVVKATYTPGERVFVRANLMDNVLFHRVYAFKDDSFEVWSGVKCNNSDYPSNTSGHGTTFPCTMEFPEHMELDARTAVLKEWWLRFDSERSSQRLFRFYDNTALPTHSRRMEVFGPWGPKRKLTIETKTPTISPGMYAGNCPHQGFSLGIAGIGSLNNYGGFIIKVDDYVPDARKDAEDLKKFEKQQQTKRKK